MVPVTSVTSVARRGGSSATGLGVVNRVGLLDHRGDRESRPCSGPKQLSVYRVLDMKTITISDDAYRRLESLKGGRSFSETIEGLIAGSAGARIDSLLELGFSKTGREDELSEVVKGIRERTRVRTS